MGRRSKKVDTYIEQAGEFAQPVLRHVRGLFHELCPEVEETIKWGVPRFDYHGMLGGIAAFKQHVSIGFWKASLMEDEHGLLAGSGNQMSAIKVTGMDDLPDDAVLAYYIRQGMDLNERGVKLPRAARTKPSERVVDAPADLAEALAGHPEARATWDGFSYSNRKEYAEWITGAKQQATRDRRLAQAIEWMAEGKPRNWKYMPKYRS